MSGSNDGEVLHRIQRSEPVLVYSHNPGRSVSVMTILFTLCMAAGVFTWHFVREATLIAAIFAIALLYHLLKTCSVRVWLDWPNLIYSYRSLFRSVDETIPSWEITGLTPEITRIWRGSISERLVLEAGKRKFVLTPFYVSSDSAVDRLREVLNTLPSTRAQAEYEIELERRVLEGDDGEQDEEPETEVVWGMLEMSIQCPRCDGPVVVNGPVTQFICPDCSAEIEMGPDIWTDLLEDLRDELAEDTEEGQGGRSTIWGTYNTSLFYGRLRPHCLRCKRDFDMDTDYTGGDRLTCPGCGTDTAVMKAPEWFERVFQGAKLIVGAEEKQSTELETASDAEPVSFTCSKCGAFVQTRGESRSVKCSHCGTSTFLPDDLWHHFHPVPVKRRWFVGFEVPVYADED